MTNEHGAAPELVGRIFLAVPGEPWSEWVHIVHSDSGDGFELANVTEITVDLFCPEAPISAEALAEIPLRGGTVTATLTGGQIPIVQSGGFRFAFSADQMLALAQRPHFVRATVSKDGEIQGQDIIGQVIVAAVRDETGGG